MHLPLAAARPAAPLRRRPSAVAALAALAAVLLSAACDRQASDPAVPELFLTVLAGDGQSAPAGSLLAEPLRVTVKDGTGQAVQGAAIRFRVRAGSDAGAVLTDTIAVSGPGGVAATSLRVGARLETVTVDAFVPRREAEAVSFSATATDPPRLTSITPTSVAAGDTVVLRGERLSVGASANEVFFGEAGARVVEVSGDSVLRAVVPPCLPAGRVAARVVVAWAPTNALDATVARGPSLVDLEPLEGIVAAGPELGDCVQLPGGAAEYLLVAQSAAVAADGAGTIDYRIALSHDGAVAEVGGSRARSTVAADAPTPRERLHGFLRRHEREIAPEIAAGGPVARWPELSRATAAAPAIGSRRSFRVLTRLDGSATGSVTARLRYAGDHILLYTDVVEPPAPLDDGDLSRLGALFDQQLYDLAVRTFGSETDIDGNGRLVVLLTPLVNALTPPAECGSDGFVTGFFYGADLNPRSRSGNRGEIFYALVADDQGTRSCSHSKEQIHRLVPATFVHELQHMISYGQHVVARGGSDEDVWLNEGLSHIAEELASRIFEERYPHPAGRASLDQLFPDSAQGFVVPNFINAYQYLRQPWSHSLTEESGMGTLRQRGAAWLFLRWLGDQKGEGIYSRLVQTSRTSVTNLEFEAGESFHTLFGDFALAIVADGIGGSRRDDLPARYRFFSRNLRQVFQRFVEQTPSLGPTFPVPQRVLQFELSSQGNLRRSSMAYFRHTTPPGSARLNVRLTRPDGGAFPAADRMQLAIFRLR